jgi:hypothetical protein
MRILVVLDPLPPARFDAARFIADFRAFAWDLIAEHQAAELRRAQALDAALAFDEEPRPWCPDCHRLAPPHGPQCPNDLDYVATEEEDILAVQAALAAATLPDYRGRWRAFLGTPEGC